MRATVRKMSSSEADELACSVVRLFAAIVRESALDEAHAAAATNGNGTALNGALNGATLNGVALNGVAQNGAARNGFSGLAAGPHTRNGVPWGIAL